MNCIHKVEHNTFESSYDHVLGLAVTYSRRSGRLSASSLLTRIRFRCGQFGSPSFPVGTTYARI